MNTESLNTTENVAPDPKEAPLPADHPGLQRIVKNDNPRANENIDDDNEPVNEFDEDIDQVDSEITDGEDG